MKIFLLVICVIALLTASGCFLPGRGPAGARARNQTNDTLQAVSIDGPPDTVGAEMGR
jgi:hypothetical protein